MRLGYGAFEILTIILLTVMLVIFWRARFVWCLLVSFAWTTFLAGIFRYVFEIPLPGTV